MKIQVRYFHSVAKLMEVNSEFIELPDGSRVADLAISLSSRETRLVSIAPSLLFAVNSEHALRDTMLRDGDEVALMPPFSGG